MELNGKRVYVAGHGGMVGSAICRRLTGESVDLLTVDRAHVDLRRQSDVEKWMAEVRPEIVFLAAATVGGILANSRYPADFLYDNVMIATNIIHSAHRVGVEKLVFLGSSCIYPRLAEQPIKENSLLTGPLEPTNEWYAIAKIAGIKLCQAYRQQHGADFISVMPANLYGPSDNFDLQTSHVLPALIAKIHAAKQDGENQCEIWGSGTPKREFLFVDDLAAGLIFLTKHYSEAAHINLGTGSDVSIATLAEIIARTIGYEGAFIFDRTKPDGHPRKLMDVSRLNEIGWKATTSLEDGIARTYEWYLQQLARESLRSLSFGGPEVSGKGSAAS